MVTWLLSNLLPVIATIAIVAAFICLGAVVRKRTQRSAFYFGGILGIIGLVCALGVSLIDTSTYTEQQLAFLVNIYLVLSGVGANIFASAACVNLTSGGMHNAQPAAGTDATSGPSHPGISCSTSSGPVEA